MLFSKKNIHLKILPLQKVHNLSVSVTIPYKCSSYAFDQLMMNNLNCHSKDDNKCIVYSGAEESSVGFSLYELVREKLIGSPLEMARCKVDHVECKVHDDSLVLSWNTQGNQSSLRKTIGVVLKCMQPNSLFSRYNDNLKLLGGKPSRECFNHCANKLIDALEKNIEFVAIGKIKLVSTDDKKLMQKSFDVACNKYVKNSKAKNIHSPPKHSEYESNYPYINCSDGASAILTSEYIRTNSNGMGVSICGKKIIIHSNSWGSKQSALKNKARIKSYVEAKYYRLGDLSGLYIAYLANSQAMGTASNIIKLEKINPKEAIEKSL
jgi:hypothetical protein